MAAIKSSVQKVVNNLTPKGKGETILVSGVSGYVAAHVVRNLLEGGYNVRGTVRSNSKAEAVKKHFPEHVKQLSFAIVEDVAAPGAFDEAVKGVDGVSFWNHGGAQLRC
jgi:nucleoside-diphosphate-sugar epimerase